MAFNVEMKDIDTSGVIAGQTQVRDTTGEDVVKAIGGIGDQLHTASVRSDVQGEVSKHEQLFLEQRGRLASINEMSSQIDAMPQTNEVRKSLTLQRDRLKQKLISPHMYRVMVSRTIKGAVAQYPGLVQELKQIGQQAIGTDPLTAEVVGEMEALDASQRAATAESSRDYERMKGALITHKIVPTGNRSFDHKLLTSAMKGARDEELLQRGFKASQVEAKYAAPRTVKNTYNVEQRWALDVLKGVNSAETSVKAVTDLQSMKRKSQLALNEKYPAIVGTDTLKEAFKPLGDMYDAMIDFASDETSSEIRSRYVKRLDEEAYLDMDERSNGWYSLVVNLQRNLKQKTGASDTFFDSSVNKILKGVFGENLDISNFDLAPVIEAAKDQLDPVGAAAFESSIQKKVLPELWARFQSLELNKDGLQEKDLNNEKLSNVSKIVSTYSSLEADAYSKMTNDEQDMLDRVTLKSLDSLQPVVARNHITLKQSGDSIIFEPTKGFALKDRVDGVKMAQRMLNQAIDVRSKLTGESKKDIVEDLIDAANPKPKPVQAPPRNASRVKIEELAKTLREAGVDEDTIQIVSRGKAQKGSLSQDELDVEAPSLEEIAVNRNEEANGGIVKDAMEWLKSKKGSVKGMSVDEVIAQWEEESTVARAKNKDKKEKLNKKDLGAQYNQQIKGALRDLLDFMQ